MIRVLVSYFICYSLFTEPCFCVSYFRCRNNCSCSSRSSLFYSSTSTSCICIYYYSLSLCFMSCFSISCKTIFFLFYIYSFVSIIVNSILLFFTISVTADTNSGFCDTIVKYIKKFIE